MTRCLRLIPCWLLLVCALGAQAQQTPEFPELTGRVVDQAEILDSQTESRLTQMLAAHEQATTEQVVVVTLPDLQGQAIEEYGYQLGRQWGIGQEGEDNGALLIVAMDERAIRIEVGYGLEGRLTDAQASLIINRIISPAFRQGDYEQGITQATEAIIQVLGGEPLEGQGPAARESAPEPREGPMSVLFFVMFVIVMALVRGGGGRGGRGRGGILTGALL
ncbi:YgcG family protein, partial [Halomonas sp. BBD45]